MESAVQMNLGLEGVVEEDVGRLDVPVYDPRMACRQFLLLVMERLSCQEHCRMNCCCLQSSCRYVSPRAAPIAIFIRLCQSITGSPFPADHIQQFTFGKRSSRHGCRKPIDRALYDDDLAAAADRAGGARASCWARTRRRGGGGSR